MSHHHYHHHHHHYHGSSETSKYDYDYASNRRQIIMAIVFITVAAAMLTFGVLFYTVWDKFVLATFLVGFGIGFSFIGISLIADANTKRKTAAKFVKCLDCGTVNKNGRELCENCGKPLRTFCQKCGREIGGGNNFCTTCGHKSQFDLPSE